MSDALGVPVYRAGDKVPLPLLVDESMAKFSTKEDNQQRHQSTFGAKPSVSVAMSQPARADFTYFLAVVCCSIEPYVILRRSCRDCTIGQDLESLTLNKAEPHLNPSLG